MRPHVVLLLASSLFLAAGDRCQASILVRQAPLSSIAVYGERGFFNLATPFKNMLDTRAANAGLTVQVVQDFADTSQVSAAQALFVDIGNVGTNPGSTLSVAEIANIQTFIATGKRVVMFGENSIWDPWNDSILATVGGAAFEAAHGETLSRNPLVPSELTDQVDSVSFLGAGSVLSGDFDSLFTPGTSAITTQGTAALWGDANNVLTVLDISWIDSSRINLSDNRRFAENIADWIVSPVAAAPVPEPSTLLMWSLLGIGAATAVARRPRRR